MKFILLNGPPRSGKDTAAAALCGWLQPPVRHEKFSAPLKHAFAGMMGAECENFVVHKYEAMKDAPIPDLGFSFRQWQIDFSETFMKSCYRNDVFGRLLLKRLEEHPPEDNAVIVISDCGFQIEVDYLVGAVPQPNNDIALFRLHRASTSFVGDSREYVQSPRCDNFDVHNDGTIEEFQSRIYGLVKWWLAKP